MAAVKLRGFCERVDRINPKSEVGKMISSLVVGAKNLEIASNMVKEEITQSKETQHILNDSLTEIVLKYEQKRDNVKKILGEKLEEIKTFELNQWNIYIHDNEP